MSYFGLEGVFEETETGGVSAHDGAWPTSRKPTAASRLNSGYCSEPPFYCAAATEQHRRCQTRTHTDTETDEHRQTHTHRETHTHTETDTQTQGPEFGEFKTPFLKKDALDRGQPTSDGQRSSARASGKAAHTTGGLQTLSTSSSTQLGAETDERASDTPSI